MKGKLTKKQLQVLEQIINSLPPKDKAEVLQIIQMQQGAGYNEIMESIGKYLGKILYKLFIPKKMQK